MRYGFIRWIRSTRLEAKRMGLGLLFALATPTAVQAQFVCDGGPGPGQRQVGMGGGGPGVAPVPLCVQDATPATQGNSEPQADPLTDLNHSLTELVGLQFQELKNRLKMVENMNRMRNEPEDIKFQKGYWTHFYDIEKPESGEGCAAIFTNVDGAVQISGPTSFYNGAILILMGNDIPKPEIPTNLKVTLDQGPGSSQTLTAVNYTPLDDGKIGAVAFAVTSIDAALKGMKDVLTFKVLLGKKQIVHVTYHDGLKAQSSLKHCLSGHPVLN